MTGIELIARERQEQLVKHGYKKEHDEMHEGKELAWIAEMLLAAEHEEGIDSDSFPEGFEDICASMLSKPYKDRLIIAGALIAAEIDRLEPENFTSLWNIELLAAFDKYIDPNGWLTEDWAYIIDDEIPKYDEGYNDTGQRERLYNLMYNTVFVKDEINNKIRPVKTACPEG